MCMCVCMARPPSVYSHATRGFRGDCWAMALLNPHESQWLPSTLDQGRSSEHLRTSCKTDL